MPLAFGNKRIPNIGRAYGPGQQTKMSIKSCCGHASGVWQQNNSEHWACRRRFYFLTKLLFYKELGVPMAFHHKHRFCCCTCVGVPMDLGRKQSSGHRICVVTWRRLVGYPRDTRGIPAGYLRDMILVKVVSCSDSRDTRGIPVGYPRDTSGM